MTLKKSSYCVSYAYKISPVSSGHTPASPDSLSEAPAMHKVRVAVPLIIYHPWFLTVSVPPSLHHLMAGNHTGCNFCRLYCPLKRATGFQLPWAAQLLFTSSCFTAGRRRGTTVPNSVTLSTSWTS